MGKINAQTLRDWNNGETMFEADYESEREIIRTAVNDNFDRLIKKFEVVDAAGVTKGTQDLDTAINYLRFQEDATIVMTLDTATATLKFAVVDGSITTAKLSDLGVTTDKIADGNVTTIKLADLNVTRDKLADNAVNLKKLDLTDLDTRYYTESEVDGFVDGLQNGIDESNTNLTNHKTSGDHDTRYYQKIQLDNGALDNRYYTEAEVNNLLSQTGGGMAISVRKDSVFPSTHNEGEILYREDTDRFYVSNGSTWVEFARAADLNAHVNSTNPHNVTPEQIGAYHSADLEALRADLNGTSRFRTGKDANGKFTTVEYDRPNGTLAMKSVLSNLSGDNYTTRTETYYESDGTTVKETFIFTLVYDVDGDWIREELT